VHTATQSLHNRSQVGQTYHRYLACSNTFEQGSLMLKWPPLVSQGFTGHVVCAAANVKFTLRVVAAAPQVAYEHEQ
jgi:hypothetical protein